MSLTDAPRILVFAGPNGSGKSSVTSAWHTVGLYINADDIKAKRGSTDLEAAQEAECMRELCIAEHRSFTFETVNIYAIMQTL
jgi:predicted ABC-type ATPase